MLIQMLSRLFWVWCCLSAAYSGGEGDDGDQGDAGDQGDSDDTGDDAGDLDGDDGADDLDSGDDDTPSDDDDTSRQKPASRATKRVTAALAAKEAAEAERDTIRRELEEHRRNVQQAASQRQAQTELEREEAVLNNPDTSADEKWRIQANRSIKASEQRASMALAQAQDTLDRAEFREYAQENPEIAAKYRDRVESTLKQLRAQGQNASRSDILINLLGRDLMSGKTKPKAAAKPKAAPARAAAREPNRRSDVQARGNSGGTTRQQLLKRLEGREI